MTVLDPKAAADHIRSEVLKTAGATVSALNRHIDDFVTSVTAELGLLPTWINHNIVKASLDANGIQNHAIQEYPKVVGQKPATDSSGKELLDPDTGRTLMVDIVAHSADEEAALRPKAPPVKEPTKVVPISLSRDQVI